MSANFIHHYLGWPRFERNGIAMLEVLKVSRTLTQGASKSWRTDCVPHQIPEDLKKEGELYQDFNPNHPHLGDIC